MSFDMALPHTQRVQAILPDGKEVLPEVQELWDLYRAAETAISKLGGGPSTEGGEESDAAKEGKNGDLAPPKALNPQRVLDRLQEAKAEMDVVVDLVCQLEAAQFLAVAHVPKRVSIDAIARDRALALASRQAGLRTAAARLRQGAGALAVGIEAEATLLADLARLQGVWHLRRAGSGFQARLLPEGLLPDDAHASFQAVALEQTAAGHVMCDSARGAEAVAEVLQSRQEAALWRGAARCLAEREGVPARLRRLACATAAQRAQHAGGAEPMDVEGEVDQGAEQAQGLPRHPAENDDASTITSLDQPRFKLAVLRVLSDHTTLSQGGSVELAEALECALLHEERCCDVEGRLRDCPELTGVHAVRAGAAPDVTTICFMGNGAEGCVVVRNGTVQLLGPFWPEEYREARLGSAEELTLVLHAAVSER